ncbi:hypothetical protein P8C59_003806 [Phyllachora maydis]|uniref:Uncharacterized protein n=1 Tax=Phyllachora maydis TaxID=1825666 RepID=A0AAD9I256_9PEZI|nr:hypothetical protein P8C59_003806 [Phyllachora maydis]
MSKSLARPEPRLCPATSLIRLPRPSKQGREISRYLITLVHLHLDHPIGRVVLQILSLVTKHRSVGMKSSNHLTRLRNAKACGSVARFFMLALALVHLIVPICHAQVHVHGAHELGVTAAVASLSAPFEASTVYARFEENINGNMATDCDTSSAPAPSSTLSAGNTIPSVEPVSETVVSSEEPTVVTVTRTATVKPKSHSTSAFLTTNVTTTYVSKTVFAFLLRR